MVSVDEVPEEGTGGGEWLLLRLVNLSTYKRCKAALHAVDERKGVSQELVDVCFGRCEPRFDSRPFSDHVLTLLRPFPPPSSSCSTPSSFVSQLPLCEAASLNPSQVEAVRLCLAAQNVALVHGPPGTGEQPPLSSRLPPHSSHPPPLPPPLNLPLLYCNIRNISRLLVSGKTSTVAVAIQALVARGTCDIIECSSANVSVSLAGLRVLVCAPSNVAVDNITGFIVQFFVVVVSNCFRS